MTVAITAYTARQAWIGSVCVIAGVDKTVGAGFLLTEKGPRIRGQVFKRGQWFGGPETSLLDLVKIEDAIVAWAETQVDNDFTAWLEKHPSGQWPPPLKLEPHANAQAVLIQLWARGQFTHELKQIAANGFMKEIERTVHQVLDLPQIRSEEWHEPH